MIQRTLLTFLIVAAIGSSTPTQADQLGIPDQYLVGGEPRSVFSADFNGDNYDDLATVSYQTDSLTVLLNDGDGTFTLSAAYLTGDLPVYVHGADINGDNYVDLAVAEYGEDVISIYTGNGDGTFGPPTTVASGHRPTSVRLAQLNGDGHVDMIATTDNNTSPGGDDQVSVLLGNGDGTFMTLIGYNVGEEPQESAVADFNGDGSLDIAAVNLMSHTISVLINNGDGTFGADVAYESQHMPSAVSAADLNGDGHIDLIAPNSDAYDRSVVAIIKGNGDGSFQPTVYVNSGGYPFDTFVCDLDQDSDIDIIVANWATDEISLLINNGDATFEEPVQYSAGDNPKALFSADLNNDTYPDLAVANLGSNDILVYANSGTANHADDNQIFGLPVAFRLNQNAPNPFNPATIIAYDLVRGSHVNLSVYNVLGQSVTVLVDGKQSAGPHSVLWDGSESASGVYFYRLTAGQERATRKMILLK